MSLQLIAKHFPQDLQNKAQDLTEEAVEKLIDIKERRCIGAEWVGWYDYPKVSGFTLAEEIKKFQSELDVFYDTVIVIGIGGSYLGTRAISDALSHEYQMLLEKDGRSKRPLMIYAGQHLSEAGLVELLDVLDGRQPIVNVISKSGTTTEPAASFRIIRQYMEERFGRDDCAKRIIATTDKSKGALRELATKAGYKTFVVPDDVGGRFSVLTAVGLVPLALGGFDIQALLKGAASQFAQLEQGHLAKAAPVQYAVHRHAAYEEGKRVEVLATGEPKLRNVIEWWKQLFGESEGKSHKGLLPVGLTYTTDLHSLGQYIQDGARSMLETFLHVENARSRDERNVERRLSIPKTEQDLDGLGYLQGRSISDINEAALVGTRVAHSDGGVPTLELRVSQLDEEGLGELLAFFEISCGISGALLGVNPYDQPGVEAYKKNLFALLGKPGFEELGETLKSRL